MYYYYIDGKYSTNICVLVRTSFYTFLSFTVCDISVCLCMFCRRNGSALWMQLTHGSWVPSLRSKNATACTTSAMASLPPLPPNCPSLKMASSRIVAADCCLWYCIGQIQVKVFGHVGVHVLWLLDNTSAKNICIWMYTDCILYGFCTDMIMEFKGLLNCRTELMYIYWYSQTWGLRLQKQRLCWVCLIETCGTYSGEDGNKSTYRNVEKRLIHTFQNQLFSPFVFLF